MPGCKGSRLKPESLAVLVGGHSISDICALAIADCAKFLKEVDFTTRAADRRARHQGDRRPARVPPRRRPRLPLARPARRNPLRWRGAADPAGHADRIGARRRALRPRRAQHRPAPARQPPADRDSDPAARPRQHPHRRRARRGHHHHRGLGGRHRAGRGRARRQGGPLGTGPGPARAPRVHDREVPLRPARIPTPVLRRTREKGREVTVVGAREHNLAGVDVCFPWGHWSR